MQLNLSGKRVAVYRVCKVCNIFFTNWVSTTRAKNCLRISLFTQNQAGTEKQVEIIPSTSAQNSEFPCFLAQVSRKECLGLLCWTFAVLSSNCLKKTPQSAFPFSLSYQNSN